MVVSHAAKMPHKKKTGELIVIIDHRRHH